MAMAIDLIPVHSYNEFQRRYSWRAKEDSGMRLLLLVLSGLLIFPCRLLPATGRRGGETFRRLYLQGSTFRNQGDFENSRRFLKEALAFADRDRASLHQGKCLLMLGLVAWDLGEMGESSACFGDAARAFEAGRDIKARELCSKCLDVVRFYNLGKEDRKAGLLHRSVSRFEDASRLGREIGIPDFTLKCLRQQALTYLDLRMFDLFLENSRQGLNIATQIRHAIGRVDV